jgi:plasmid rolling circle replication initiator protein Rep
LNTINLDKNQVLIDRHPTTGERIKWEVKKGYSQNLVESLKRLELNNGKLDLEFAGRSAKCADCGDLLAFKKCEDNTLKLFKAYFCKYRLCPMCMWRRSLKIFYQVSHVMEAAKEQGYVFLFLTLTVRNCTGDDLQTELGFLQKSVDRLFKRKRFKTAISGYFKTVEITHNLKKDSLWYDTYHPHIHLILAVKKRYFRSDQYMSQHEIQNLWRSCARLDYDPSVDIRRIKPRKKDKYEKSERGSIAEVAKYCTKSNDFLVQDNPDLTDSTVKTLHFALKDKRLHSSGGIFRTIRQDLKLDDWENGDLINVDPDERINEELNYTIEHYQWHHGYKQYFKIGENKKEYDADKHKDLAEKPDVFDRVINKREYLEKLIIKESKRNKSKNYFEKKLDPKRFRVRDKIEKEIIDNQIKIF